MKLFVKLLIICVALPLLSQAQSNKKDTTEVKTGLYGVWLGGDLSQPLRRLLSDDRRFLEANVAADLGNFLLNVDYGRGTAEEFGDEGAFRSEGKYWRTGFDYNFTKREAARHAFFVGVRYAHSTFTETVRSELAYDYWILQPIIVKQEASAYWFEAVTGLKVRVAGPVFLGYTARLQFALQTDTPDRLTPYYVPGFGKVKEGTNFLFNYHLFFYLPTKSLH